ncbi:MAG: helix-turn-helix domain-containing protein [Gammaproteobacteria bacterium]|nr:helix-turn-helix domain-containing protein [Gammaproteobacteria bacterium]
MAKRDPGQPTALGEFLARVREAKGLTLRQVEEATGKDVSNAYLSQLEHGKVSKPSPNVLHSLSTVYGVSYENLMEKAGYISPSSAQPAGAKHGRAATFAIEDLSEDEEKALLAYLAMYRKTKGKS